MELGRDCRRPPHSVLADGVHHHLTVVGLVDDEDGRSAPVLSLRSALRVRVPVWGLRESGTDGTPFRVAHAYGTVRAVIGPLFRKAGVCPTPTTVLRHTLNLPANRSHLMIHAMRTTVVYVRISTKSTAPEGVTRRTEKHLTARPRQPRRRWLSGGLHLCAVRSGRRAVTESQTHRRASTIRKKAFCATSTPSSDSCSFRSRCTPC
jgi:hypothetical protein